MVYLFRHGHVWKKNSDCCSDFFLWHINEEMGLIKQVTNTMFVQQEMLQ